MTAAQNPQQPSPQEPGESEITFEGITHVLLDIEGTTCPVSFVAETLFPYASRQLCSFLEGHQHDPNVQALVDEVRQAWLRDPDPGAHGLIGQQHAPEASAGSLNVTSSVGSVVPYLQWLIEHDRKLSPLKELQGMIWGEGYRKGELVGPLFADVPAALLSWSEQNLVLAVYSSGSVKAQQLIYGYSQAGDLRALFQHWFDTRTGAKQDPSSYQTIAKEMGVKAGSVLFISDSRAELEAASAAGMAAVFSDREGNPARAPGPFAPLSNFSALRFADRQPFTPYPASQKAKQ
ncbi:MAG: acireductone synthase [Prochlorococcaceae cyanobacterium]